MRDIDLSLFFYCRQGKDEKNAKEWKNKGNSSVDGRYIGSDRHWMRCFYTGTVSGACMAADNRHLYGFPLGTSERKADKKNGTGKRENDADRRS